MTSFVDRAVEIRQGEELDLARLEPYLRENITNLAGEMSVLQFPGGHSNLTYLVGFENRSFVLRRAPFGGKVKSAHDMGREYNVLSKLHPVYPLAPKPWLYCEDESILGAIFYVMDRVEGTILRDRPPEGFSLPPEKVRACCDSFITNLARLHSLDWESAGLADLRREGQYTERQVVGWAKRYQGSRTDDIPDVDRTATWLAERIPPDSGAVLVHNDYKFDNIALDPEDPARAVAVFDWEMSTIGDPLMDLGTTLAYWAEPSDADELKVVQSFLTAWPGAMTREELAARYFQETEKEPVDLLFCYVFALFKLAVIVQQIYYRYHKGLTQDPRFAGMIDMVRVLGRKSVQSIETGRISNGS